MYVVKVSVCFFGSRLIIYGGTRFQSLEDPWEGVTANAIKHVAWKVCGQMKHGRSKDELAAAAREPRHHQASAPLSGPPSRVNHSLVDVVNFWKMRHFFLQALCLKPPKDAGRTGPRGRKGADRRMKIDWMSTQTPWR